MIINGIHWIYGVHISNMHLILLKSIKNVNVLRKTRRARMINRDIFKWPLEIKVAEFNLIELQ